MRVCMCVLDVWTRSRRVHRAGPDKPSPALRICHTQTHTMHTSPEISCHKLMDSRTERRKGVHFVVSVVFVCVTNHCANNTAIIRWTIAPKCDVNNIYCLHVSPPPSPTLPPFVRNDRPPRMRSCLMTLCTEIQLFTENIPAKCICSLSRSRDVGP